eukprot:958005-Amphidinium_carterae.1
MSMVRGASRAAEELPKGSSTSYTMTQDMAQLIALLTAEGFADSPPEAFQHAAKVVWLTLSRRVEDCELEPIVARAGKPMGPIEVGCARICRPLLTSSNGSVKSFIPSKGSGMPGVRRHLAAALLWSCQAMRETLCALRRSSEWNPEEFKDQRTCALLGSICRSKVEGWTTH